MMIHTRFHSLSGGGPFCQILLRLCSLFIDLFFWIYYVVSSCLLRYLRASYFALYIICILVLYRWHCDESHRPDR